MSAPTLGSTGWRGTALAVIGVQTNGQCPLDLVELAIARIVGGEPQTPQTWLVRPPHPITAAARRVHGISNGDVAQAATVAQIEDEVLDAFAGVDAVVGHRVGRDLDVIAASFPRWVQPPAIDTWRLAQSQYPTKPLDRMPALLKALGLAEPARPWQPQWAAWDATMTSRLLLRLAVSFPEPVTLASLLLHGSLEVTP